MVLPVSGFLPVPLPMMIPFMGAQSLVIGKMFGEGFQYGKRKISAMGNEEFNKLTFQDMMSNARSELKASIPTMNASLHDMDAMVETIIDKFVGYLQTVIERSPQILTDVAGSVAASGLGGPVGIVAEKVFRSSLSQSQALLYAKYQLAAALPKNTPPRLGLSQEERRFSPLQLQAIEKQRVHEAEVERLRIARVNLSTQTRQTLSVTPQVRQGTTQRAAGQSQRMERTRLINIIAKAAKDLKIAMTQGGVRGDTRSIQNLARTLAEHQQALVNLLARYRF